MKCDYCTRKATWTAYREVGFGVQVTVAKVCGWCKKKLKGGLA